jgi:hypothetical protein
MFICCFSKYIKVLKKMDNYRSHFFDNVMNIRKSIDWPNRVFCISRRVCVRGGLGIIDLDVQNKCLQSK